MSYLYETHLHTTGVSRCAISRGSDYIAGYMEMGYSGMIVTDHFYNGNSALPKNLPWKEWVNRFYHGFEEAKEEGDRRGFDVFFGWEETFDGCDDYLIYGLDKNWLLAHPEARSWTRGEQYVAVKEAGGCVVQAHPFRQRFYIPKIILSTACVDGVEVVNGGHEDLSYDALAYRYAQKIGKTATGGTDIHDASSIYYSDIFGVYLEKKLNSIDDYVKIICGNKISKLKMEERRLEFDGDEDVKIPVETRDKNDKVINKHWKEFI